MHGMRTQGPSSRYCVCCCFVMFPFDSCSFLCLLDCMNRQIELHDTCVRFTVVFAPTFIRNALEELSDILCVSIKHFAKSFCSD